MFESIETSHSTVHFENTPCHYKELRKCKSDEDNRDNSKIAQKQDDVLFWWQLYRDKEKITKWEERLQRLAQKLIKPGGEEKLKLKIEKYLRKVPSYFSDCDEDSKGFRDTLPDIIVNKLKEYYVTDDNKDQTNFKEPEYEHKSITAYYKSIIKRWLQKIAVHRTVVKNDIVEFIVHKIEPFILSKPKYDAEFKYILKSNLIDLLNEISIVIDSKNKKDFLNRITDDLIENLFKKDITYISENRVKNVSVNCELGIENLKIIEKEIMDFITNQLTQFFKSLKLCISARTKFNLERELANLLMSSINSLTLTINREDISIVLQRVGELSEHQARDFINKLIENLNGSFWELQRTYDNKEELPKFLTNASYHKNINLSHQYKKVENEIENWLKRHQIYLFQDAKFRKTVVKDLIKNISRNSTLVKNTLHYSVVEYEVRKWIRKLVGDNIIQNIDILDLVEKLIDGIEPSIKVLPAQLSARVVCQNVEVNSGLSPQRNLSYVEELVDIIFDWYHGLPYNLTGSFDVTFNSHLIKELAERIYSRILSKGNSIDVIDNEVDTWLKNTLGNKLDVTLIEDLKSKIKNVTFSKKLMDREILDKDLLKMYEYYVDEWLDKLYKDPARVDLYVESKNNLIKELAARLYEIKKSQGELDNDFVMEKMKREVSEWLIKVPIHPKLNISRQRDIMAKMLTNMLKENNSPFINKDKTTVKFIEKIEECAIIDWLKEQPLYTKNNGNDKLKQEEYMTKLIHVINEIKNGRSFNIDEEIVKYVKKLDLKQEYDDEFIQQIVEDLKMFLENVMKYKCHEGEDKNLTEIIKQWLQSLPLNITSEREYNMVECHVKELLNVFKQARVGDSKDKNQLLDVIKKIIKLLPIECKTKCNEIFLTSHSKSLLDKINLSLLDKIGKVDENFEHENSETKIPIMNPGTSDDLNFNNYMRQLTEQIEEWLINIRLPTTHNEKGLRSVVINELAKDIIDRAIYLEKNPSSRGTNIEEIDHLKFQIFKWINKLVGEENLETVEHAPELMQRIRSIRYPQNKNVGNINVDTRQSLGAGPSSYRRNRSTNFQVVQAPVLGLPASGGSMVKGLEKGLYNKGSNNPLGFPVGYIPNTYANNGFDAPAVHIENYANLSNMNQQANSNTVGSNMLLRSSAYCESESGEPPQLENPEVAEGITVEQIYDEYEDIFRQRSNEIPLDVSTPEEQTVVNYVRQGIVNIIWNTYFKLKSNPEIESDYRYVEILMEEALDDIFNDLPTTSAIQRIKHTWKIKVLKDVIAMLKKVHSVTDSSYFKLLLASRKHRLIAKAVRQEATEDILNYFVVTTLEMYLIQRNYNERDSIKANVYKLRLMKYIEDLVRRVEFYGITNERLHEVRMMVLNALNNLPEPGTDILPSELNEIEIGYVIENWFQELPGIIPQREAVEQIWSRLRQLLARKINTLEMRVYADEFELDRMIMHEASLFLERPKMLCDDNDLRINEMAQELANRLRERRQNQVIPQYRSFEQNQPLCSSMVQVNLNVNDPLPTNRSPIERHLANLSRREEQASLQTVQPDQMSMAASVVQPPVLQANLNNQSRPQALLHNSGQKRQSEGIASIHEQMRSNTVNNTPPLVRITTGVVGHTSHIEDPGTPSQGLKTSHLDNVPRPVQGQPSNELPRPQIAFGSPRHGLRNVQVNNLAENGSPAQNDNRAGDARDQVHSSQLVSGPPVTNIPINQARIPQTELSTRQAVRNNQELLLPSSRPPSTRGTRSTVRVGDVGNDIVEERVGKRSGCTCAEKSRCNRRKYICYCDDDDDDDDEVYVPCKYYF